MARSPWEGSVDPDPDTLTIALLQMDVRAGRPEVNLAEARRLLAQAADSGADLALLPELWLHGYDLTHAARWAAPLGQGPFRQMADWAVEFGLYLAGSLLEAHAGGVSNTAVLLDPAGTLLGSYRKLHLFRLMDEHRYLVEGRTGTLCFTPWGLVGLAVCYDLRFPELFRACALAGAGLILLPAQWPARRIEHWSLLLRARAVENQLFVAGCNRAGSEGETRFPGASAVVGPWGRVEVEAGERTGVFTAVVHLAEMDAARRFLPVLEDRRPGTYRVTIEPPAAMT